MKRLISSKHSNIFLLCFTLCAVLAGVAAAHEKSPHAAHSTGHEAHSANASLEGLPPLPGRSVYQLQGQWHKAEGGTMALADLRGVPIVTLLFYGTCAHACPTLVHELQRLDKKLKSEERNQVKYLLVTFDPENDTPESLKEFADQKGLDLERWKFLHGDTHQIRELALLLGVQYRPTGSGSFSHTSRLTLLDRDGLIVAAADGIENPHAELVQPLRELLGTASKRSVFQKLFGWLRD